MQEPPVASTKRYNLFPVVGLVRIHLVQLVAELEHRAHGLTHG